MIGDLLMFNWMLLYDTIELEHWIHSYNANSCDSAQDIAAENNSEYDTYWW